MYIALERAPEKIVENYFLQGNIASHRRSGRCGTTSVNDVVAARGVGRARALGRLTRALRELLESLDGQGLGDELATDDEGWGAFESERGGFFGVARDDCCDF